MKRTLGKSGIEVSALGLGCWAIGGPWEMVNNGEQRYPAGWGDIDDQESIRAIHAGLDKGVNFFDTAANYGAGHSEVVLGKALKGRRDQVVIATKFGFVVDEQEKLVTVDDDALVGNIRQDCEESLRRLDTDYIDVFQLHQGALPTRQAQQVMAECEKLVQEGKIRWYGWSTDVPDCARVFGPGEHCTSIQFRLNAFYRQDEVREVIAQHNLAGINKDPLNKGILTGKFNTQSTFPDNDIRHSISFESGWLAARLDLIDDLRDALTTGGRTMAQGALCYIWALDERMIPIPGFKSVQQVEDNAGALAFGPLDETAMRQVQEIVSRHPDAFPQEA